MDDEHGSASPDSYGRLESAWLAFKESAIRLTCATPASPSDADDTNISVLLDHAKSMDQALGHILRERTAIIDSLPAHVAVLSPDGNIVAVNHEWRRFADANALLSAEYGLGMNYLEICDTASGDSSINAQEIGDGIRTVLKGALESFSADYPCHGPSNKRWFRVFVSPVPQDGGRGAVVMHSDITTLKLAETDAREIRNRLELLVGRAPIGILVHNHFKPLVVNDEFARIFGYATVRDVLKLQDCRVLMAEHKRNQPIEFDDHTQEGERVGSTFDFVGLRKDGIAIDLEARAFRTQWGESAAVCVMLTDVTEQRNLEKQLKQAHRLEAIGQLTGGVAHDFNNLLTVILGCTETLAESLAENSDLLPLAELSRKAATRGAELTDRLLAFSRRQGLAPISTDIHSLVRGMDRLFRRTLGENIEIRIIADEALWAALVDVAQLETALLNLCLNARDAMSNGGTITISLKNTVVDETYAKRHLDASPGQYVAISVTDTGIGMDDDTLARALVPFFTTKEVGKGSGLGLSMVYGFVRQSGGHIHLASCPGKGTTVQLFIPRAESEPAETTPTENKSSLPLGEGRILLVEDDELVRMHVASQLRTLGYQVMSATNGHEALQVMAQPERIDLLLTDVVMPAGMNGVELANAARSRQPGLPILLMSGYADDVLLRDGSNLGNWNLLRKPYTKHDLAAKIREVLSEGRSALA